MSAKSCSASISVGVIATVYLGKKFISDYVAKIKPEDYNNLKTFSDGNTYKLSEESLQRCIDS